MARSCLYEAANVLLTKVQRFSPLKASGMKLAKRIGGKKARIVNRRRSGALTHFWYMLGYAVLISAES